MLSSSTHHDTRDRIHPERNLEEKHFYYSLFFLLVQDIFSFILHFVFFCITYSYEYIYMEKIIFVCDRYYYYITDISFVKNKTATIYFSSF